MCESMGGGMWATPPPPPQKYQISHLAAPKIVKKNSNPLGSANVFLNWYRKSGQSRNKKTRTLATAVLGLLIQICDGKEAATGRHARD